jgi:hypothetical protein
MTTPSGYCLRLKPWLLIRERAKDREADFRALRAREDQVARMGGVALWVRCVDGVYRDREEIGFGA